MPLTKEEAAARHLKSTREWNKRNRERIAGYKRDWRLRNHDVVREKERVVERKAYWGTRRDKILVDRVCEICGKQLRGEKGHKWCTECAKVGKRIWTRDYWTKRGKYAQRRGPDWELQKARALARDGRRCRCCGTRKAVMHVHHIREYSGLPTDNELINLITLCISCHMRGHKTRVFTWR